MKYRCFCHKDFYDLTVTEIKEMRRKYEKFIDISSFLVFYDITAREYIDRIRDMKGISPVQSEKIELHNELENNKEKHKTEKYQLKSDSTLPEWFYAAIFDVDYKVNGKTVKYNENQMNDAKEKLDKKLKDFKYEVELEINSQYDTALSGDELTDLRSYRKATKEYVSNRSGLLIGVIDYFESGYYNIPDNVVQGYFEALNVNMRHVYQLRDLKSGKITKITDNRKVPDGVKEKVRRRDGNKCVNCGRMDDLHFHHVKHFSVGGQNTKENLKLLCASCHAKEHEGEQSYHMLKALAER